MKAVTRFAPSPTGFMHVGGVRTALFAWLTARQTKGSFILRIEDTDKAREIEGSQEHIQACLKWLGLGWDQGPLYQSERLNTYIKYANQLINEGRAYADPYTPAEIQLFRENAKNNKKPFLFRDHRPENPPRWDGKTALRFLSDPKKYSWNDEVMGQLNTGPEVIDDFVIIKSDGFPTYNFAHIIDDHEMSVTHVIRGQEFLASVPNYLNLYEALGFNRPIFATIPHILNQQGNKKLSKRDGAKDILEYKNEGFLPEAMINFLATLGWNDGTEQEVFSVDELINKFNLSRVGKNGAHFDERRLRFLNGVHIRSLPLSDLAKLVDEFWPTEAKEAKAEYKHQVLSLVQERLKYFAELGELTRFFFIDLPINPELISSNKKLGQIASNDLKQLLEESIKELDGIEFSSTDEIQNCLNDLLEKTEQKPAVLFSLIRIATTQSPASPELAPTLFTLGKAKTIKRLRQQIDNL